MLSVGFVRRVEIGDDVAAERLLLVAVVADQELAARADQGAPDGPAVGDVVVDRQVRPVRRHQRQPIPGTTKIWPFILAARLFGLLSVCAD